MKTTLVIPDIQHPYHDPVALKKIIKVAADMQPEAIFQIGDGIDFPQIGQWAEGTGKMFDGSLQNHIDSFVASVLEPLREACPSADITWLEGNHDARLKNCIEKNAPQLGSLRALDMKAQFGLEELNIQYVRGPHRVATNTYAIHGHEAPGYAASPSAWDLKYTKRHGSDKSFIFGHTHQPFLLTRAFGYDGKVTPRFTMNVGSIMDPVAATYVKDGAVSWVPSFALLRDDGKRVWPELVTMVDRIFYVSGERY